MGIVESRDGSKAVAGSIDGGGGLSVGRVDFRDGFKMGACLEGSIEFWNGSKTGGDFEFEGPRGEVKSGLKARGFSNEGVGSFANEE